MKIVIVGSSNIDIISLIKHLPVSGHTIGKARLIPRFGEKGPSQTISVAKEGAKLSIPSFKEVYEFINLNIYRYVYS